MTEVDYRFRHTITDALYDFQYRERADGILAGETVMYPIVKRTARYVYVHDRLDWDQRRLIRFSVADLEGNGRAWNAANRLGLCVRPMPHWPLMPAEVRKPDQLAIHPPAASGSIVVITLRGQRP